MAEDVPADALKATHAKPALNTVAATGVAPNVTPRMTWMKKIC